MPLVLLGVAVLGAGAFAARRELALELYALASPAPELLPPADEGPGVRWFDDYYTLEEIDDRTIAIGEPRYYQGNYDYLILGDERALLFDSGPGVRDITPVVESLTDLPVTAVPSHLHYDHIGNHARFERVAFVDLPWLRERAPDGVLRPTRYEYLGFVEGRSPPALRISEWWKPGERVDLGSRQLEVIHTPGHTRDSISLYDADRHQLFTGDYVTEGALFAFVPGSSLADYLRTAEALLPRLPADVALLTAHREAPPGAPRLDLESLRALRQTLRGIRAGERDAGGVFPRVYPVTPELELWSDFAWLERWD